MAAAAQMLNMPPLKLITISSQPIVALGKTAYVQRQQAGKSVGSSKLAGSRAYIASALHMLAPETTIEQQDEMLEPAHVPIAGALRTLAPETTVELQDALREPAEKINGRSRKKTNYADYDPAEVKLQRQAIAKENEQLDDVEKVDKLLAAQQAMHCADWQKS